MKVRKLKFQNAIGMGLLGFFVLGLQQQAVAQGQQQTMLNKSTIDDCNKISDAAFGGNHFDHLSTDKKICYFSFTLSPDKCYQGGRADVVLVKGGNGNPIFSDPSYCYVTYKGRSDLYGAVKMYTQQTNPGYDEYSVNLYCDRVAKKNGIITTREKVLNNTISKLSCLYSGTVDSSQCNGSVLNSYGVTRGLVRGGSGSNALFSDPNYCYARDESTLVQIKVASKATPAPTATPKPVATPVIKVEITPTATPKPIAAPVMKVCTEKFYGQTSTENHPRVEEPGVTMCDYPNPINDSDCVDLKTKGTNGTWCQKYSDDHKFLFSAPRSLATVKPASTPVIKLELTPTPKPVANSCIKLPLGDLNHDGKIDATDADLVQKCVLGNAPVGTDCKKGDVNSDGDVSVLDAALIKLHIKNGCIASGIAEIIKAPTPTVTPKPISTPVIKVETKPCSEKFYGQTSGGNHPRIEEPGVIVCDYPNPINDSDCVDLKTQGTNGTWCQKYSTDHKFLYSAPRSLAIIKPASTPVIKVETTPTPMSCASEGQHLRNASLGPKATGPLSCCTGLVPVIPRRSDGGLLIGESATCEKPVIKPTPTATPKPISTPVIKVEITPTPKPVANSCIKLPLGDLNHDGKIDATDADLVQKCVLGNAPVGTDCKKGDVNSDGDVSVLDAALIKLHIKNGCIASGIAEIIKAPTPTVTPKPISTPVIKVETKPCSEKFYGQTSGGNHPRIEEPGVIVCDYPNPINDSDCVDLKTQGTNGTWCQKYSADHKFLFSAPRKLAEIKPVPTPVIKVETAPSPKPTASPQKVETVTKPFSISILRGKNPCTFSETDKKYLFDRDAAGQAGSKFISAQYLNCTDAKQVPNPTKDINSGWSAIYHGTVVTKP